MNTFVNKVNRDYTVNTDLHKDTISNGRCVVIGEIYGTNNVKRASKEIVDATTQMSSQQVSYLGSSSNYVTLI